MANPVVHLRGSDSCLGRSLISRLIRADVEIVIPDIDYQWAEQKFSTELKYSNSQLTKSEETAIAQGHRVILLGLGPYLADTEQSSIGVDGSETILITPGFEKIEIDTSEIDSHLIINHMLPTACDDSWCCPIIQNWYNAIINNQTITSDLRPKHWWVSEMDVADSIVRILVSDQSFPTFANISGRRAWSDDQTVEEMKLLFSRTMAGKSGMFSAQHLTTPPSPIIEVEAISQLNDNEYPRPDLESIHQVLVACDGDGWRPLMPIRSALMAFLAGAIQE
jgi:hypothetical protein